jgi:glycosyltransferase involved in cell wall biosynthesis
MKVPLPTPISDMSSSRRTSRLPILADTWYGYHYKDLCEPFEPLLKENFPSWIISLAKGCGIARGWLFFMLAQKYPSILTSTAVPGANAFFLFEALFGARRKHVILIEFIPAVKANSRSVWKRSVYHVWVHIILKPALRKSFLTVHVLTNWDRSRYSEFFGIPEEHFVFIPWPKILKNDRFVEAQQSASSERLVVSSGREACDWDTLFKAAEGQDWRLRIICTRRDLPRVRRLNKNRIADVLCDIPRKDHEYEIQQATVYVLSLLEQERSSGHVRISDATRAGTPIVATAVKGIEGYIDDGETGLLVPPGNALLLRVAVNRLLSDATFRRALARNAFEQAAKFTREDYIERIGLLIRMAVNAGTDSKERCT